MWCAALLVSLPLFIAQEPATQPASQPTTMAGPMRVELDAMVETRYWFQVPPAAQSRRPELRLRFRVAGERLKEVARIGTMVVFDELVDDTGTSLLAGVDPASIDRTSTRLVSERDAVEQNGLMLMASVDPSARGSKTLARGRGSVKVVYGSRSESITIENPLRFSGKPIAHPRLTELGVSVTLLPPGNPANLPPGGKFLAYEVTAGSEKIKDVALYDAWMKRLRGMNRDMKTIEGKPCTVIQLDADVTEQTQLVIEVFPTVEEARLPVVLEGVKLP